MTCRNNIEIGRGIKFACNDNDYSKTSDKYIITMHIIVGLMLQIKIIKADG